MYEYLDRMPPELPLPARVAHMSLRLWAKDVMQNRCPLTIQRDLFLRFGVSGALWPAHIFYAWIFAHAQRPINIGCPCCGRIGDDEAMLLTAVMSNDPVRMRACLRQLLAADAVERGVRAAKGFGAELRFVEWVDQCARSTPN